MRWIMEIGLFHVIVDVVSMTESFFGVEDFVDDDNSRPYTYKKEKRPKNPQKHISFKQHTIAYMEPFSLDGFISKRFISASVTHGVTCKQVAVAGTNSKDIKAVLKSRSDIPACLAVGRFLAERAKETDVYTCTYTPRERDKFEGKLRAVVQSLGDNGIDGQFLLCVYFSGSSLRYNCQLQPNSQKHSVLEKK
ncbi:Ribosomal L18p/L5e family [Musa troglodytarum]|nr:Ribosomal L18p/L5e family [Musa troglodytarum]